jgi:hypothetical protein
MKRNLLLSRLALVISQHAVSLWVGLCRLGIPDQPRSLLAIGDAGRPSGCRDDGAVPAHQLLQLSSAPSTKKGEGGSAAVGRRAKRSKVVVGAHSGAKPTRSEHSSSSTHPTPIQVSEA